MRNWLSASQICNLGAAAQLAVCMPDFATLKQLRRIRYATAVIQVTIWLFDYDYFFDSNSKFILSSTIQAVMKTNWLSGSQIWRPWSCVTGYQDARLHCVETHVESHVLSYLN